MARMTMGLAGALLGLAACDGAALGPVRHSALQRVSSVPLAVHAPTASLAPTAAVTGPLAAPMGGGVEWQRPIRVRKALDAQAIVRHPQAAVQLPPTTAATLRRSAVPVLVPDRAALAQQWQANAEADWYTLTASVDGVTWVVQGDRIATIDPELAPTGWRAPTWRQPYVSRNEGIAEATFLAFGASYSVSVECADPEHDVRCTGDAAVQQAAAEMRRWVEEGGR